jgi:hypothetical protein
MSKELMMITEYNGEITDIISISIDELSTMHYALKRLKRFHAERCFHGFTTFDYVHFKIAYNCDYENATPLITFLGNEFTYR